MRYTLCGSLRVRDLPETRAIINEIENGLWKIEATPLEDDSLLIVLDDSQLMTYTESEQLESTILRFSDYVLEPAYLRWTTDEGEADSLYIGKPENESWFVSQTTLDDIVPKLYLLNVEDLTTLAYFVLEARGKLG